MHLIEIPEAKIKRYIPVDLSECDSDQYILMCELIFQYQIKKIDFEQFKIHAVYKLLKMKPKQSNLNDDGYKFANIALLGNLIETFFEENENNQKVIKQYYLNNPVPVIRPLIKRYYAPTNLFFQITFGEYIDALRLFHDYHATGDIEILYIMAAMFYRPKSEENQYNENSIDERVKVFKKTSIGFIYGFYLYFASFQKNLTTTQLLWNGKEIDFSILFDSSGSDTEFEIPDIGMDSIVFALSENGPFGNKTETRKTKLIEVFVKMYDIRQKELEQKSKEKNDSNK